MGRFATCVALLSAGALAGCGLYDDVDPRTVGIRGPAPTLEQASLATQDAAQRQLFNSLMDRADLTKADLPIGSANWQIITEAGLYEIDRQCDQYLSSLYRFNRDQRAARTGLTAAGATTAAILGLTGAAGVTIALTAAAFGLAANLFDASTNSVLFTIEPSAMRAVMLRSRQAYLAGIEWPKVTNRPRVMIVLQGYLQQCTPAAIEANINNAATGAPSVASTNADIALKAAAMAAPSASIMQNPRVWSFTQVTPGGSKNDPPPPPVDRRAPNLETSEQFVKSKDEIIPVQRALGVGADGDIGKFDPSKQSDTRKALAQFQAGLRRKENPSVPTPGSGLLDGPSYEILGTIKPMPLAFASPFERGLLGSKESGYSEPNGGQIEFAIQLLGGTPQPAASTVQGNLDRLAVLHSTVAKYRETTTGVPAALGKRDALDSDLFDFARKQKPEIPKPPQP